MKSRTLVTISFIIMLSACSVTTNNDVVGSDPSVITQDELAPMLTQQVPEPEQSIIKHQVVKKFEAKEKAMRMRADKVAGFNAIQSYATAPSVNDLRLAREELDRENYHHFNDNPVRLVSEAPVSTFSIDVDTGAYSNVRRFLNEGRLPNKDAVRVEELINYFSYDYKKPENTNAPFNIETEIAPTPWNENSLLLHVGLQGYEVEKQDLPAANLVFLVDVSGSMNSKDKLGLLKSGLKLLVNQLDSKDRLALVVYAGASGVVLEPTPGDQKVKIIRALDALQAGGSTNGAAGIRLAYQMAKQGYIKNGINRILLATDGDFNVGTTNFESLKQLVEKERKDGVALTTLGFGTGNYNDHLMEQLADVGNGNYSYIDNLNEARKVLVEQISSTLNTIAKDVKIQIEFNPAVVSDYRLIGYENRLLKREDFNNDKIDAGEIGAGHSVTALYEITLKGSKAKRVDDLRYQKKQIKQSNKNEIAFIKLRYKKPDEEKSELIQFALNKADILNSVKDTSNHYRFSAAVAAFGQQLRGGAYLNNFNYDAILDLARNARDKDTYGYRGEFLQMVALAKNLN